MCLTLQIEFVCQDFWVSLNLKHSESTGHIGALSMSSSKCRQWT